jgi:hypothetical protein
MVASYKVTPAVTTPAPQASSRVSRQRSQPTRWLSGSSHVSPLSRFEVVGAGFCSLEPTRLASAKGSGRMGSGNPHIALHNSFNARTARPSPAQRVHWSAQAVQRSHRALIDLHNAFIGLHSAFIGLHNAFKARTERPSLAQRVHWSAQRIQSSHGRLKSRPRRLPVTLFGFLGALSLTPFGSTIVRDLVHALL